MRVAFVLNKDAFRTWMWMTELDRNSDSCEFESVECDKLNCFNYCLLRIEWFVPNGFKHVREGESGPASRSGVADKDVVRVGDVEARRRVICGLQTRTVTAERLTWEKSDIIAKQIGNVCLNERFVLEWTHLTIPCNIYSEVKSKWERDKVKSNLK